MKIEVSGSRL